MPKIKSPMTFQERLYNKRYERETQEDYVNKVRTSVKFAENADEYKKSFTRKMHELLICKVPLNENQADFLADLYNRYTD